MDFSIARQRFYQEIRQTNAEISLARAALYLAQEEYPELVVEAYLDRLDQMATAIAEKLPDNRYPLRIIQTINQYLYEELKFSSNIEQYYDPRNSYLNHVLDRRIGIPITLSLVYLEVANRLNFPMVGIGMPGHFLIRPTVDDMEIFVDPFHQGEVLFAEDCQTRLTEIFGRSIELRSEFLAPVTPQQFLARMLGNLKAIYLSKSDAPKALAAIERILLLFPNAISERRDRGLLYYQMGRWTEARLDLEDYLAQSPTAKDAIAIRSMLRQMQQKSSET